MIYITDPLLLPLLAIIWLVDLWLWLAAASLIADRMCPRNSLCAAIRPLVHASLELVSQWSAKCTRLPMRRHTLCIAIFTSVLVLRSWPVYGITRIQPG